MLLGVSQMPSQCISVHFNKMSFEDHFFGLVVRVCLYVHAVA